MQLSKRYKGKTGRTPRNATFILVIVVLLTAIVLGLLNTLGTKKAGESNPAADYKLGQPVGNASSTLDKQIASYQDKLRTKPTDYASYSSLGLAYLQKVREVADPSYYGKAEQVFRKAIELEPTYAEALGGLGSLALSRHQFTQGLEWGLKAAAVRPNVAYYYGVMGDALIELGRYDEATQAIQKMIDLRPDLSSYSRVSYLRELNGDYNGAVEAMLQAARAGGPASENRAWVIYQLGMLYFSHNDLAQAESAFQDALIVLPKYVYAEAGMARIRFAKGDTEGALTLLKQVSQQMPLSEFIIELGDLYTATGKTAEAARQYELVRGIQKIYSENGVDTDLEMALFDADHDYNLPQALQRARSEFQVRPSIKAADILAWTLYKTGDYAAASEYIQQALRLGTQDSLLFYHAGMINLKLGKTAEARNYLDKALKLNPNFSFLYATSVRDTLKGLSA